MRWIAPVVIVLLTTPALAAQTPDANGALVGCITDPSGQRLPGVTVDVSSDSLHREVFSNATTGCYEVTDLPGGSYVMFARLLGFASVTRDQIAIAPGRTERRDFQMYVHPICECVTVVGGRTLAFLWTEADAVVRLRITGHELVYPLSITHTANVLDVWKRHTTGGPFGATMRFNQSQQYAETEPYAVGQEFVIFLRWDANRNTFARIQSDDGESGVAFAIRDGVIRGGLPGYEGMKLDSFLLRLQALSAPH